MTSLAQNVVRALADATTAANATEAVLREVAHRFDAPLAILWLLDEQGDLLVWGGDWSTGTGARKFRDVSRRLTFAPGVGLPGRVMSTGRPEFISDLAADRAFPRAAAAAAGGLRCAAAAPMLGAGGVLGVIEVFGREPLAGAFPRLEELDVAARQLAVYLDRLGYEEQLRASEERSASIVAAALDCVITMDDRGRIVDFNPAAEATFGHAREDVVGEILADVIIPPELRAAHRSALDAYVEHGEPTILGRRLELTGLRADGSTFPVELTVTRLGSDDPPLFAGFIRDITSQREAEIQRDRLLAEALTSRALAEAAQERAVAAHAAAEQAGGEAEAAGMRLALLAQAGERMLGTRDYEETMRQVVELAVPAVADWCALTIAELDGTLRIVATSHADPGKAEVGGELAARHASSTGDAIGATAVVRSGRTALISGFGEEDLRAATGDERHLELLRALELRAVLTVPLRSPRRVFGALTLAMSGSAREFGPEDVAMAESLSARAALAIENARLFSERSHIAETLQRSLLPERLPEVAGIDLAVSYRAAGEANLVGGDFYDVFRSGDGVWTAILGDVSGKGPEAAAVTALSRHTLRAGALRESSPRANLRLLNDALLVDRDARTWRFATVLYARICRDADGAVVTVCTGGHLPPLIRRANGHVEPVPCRGTMLGAIDEPELHDVDVRLDAGDLMLIYTDGVTEVRPREPDYGENLLRRVLREHGAAPAAEVVAAVEDAAVAAQDGEPRDDIALVAIRAVGE